jgi:hypothetical protein
MEGKVEHQGEKRGQSDKYEGRRTGYQKGIEYFCEDGIAAWYFAGFLYCNGGNFK